MNKNTIHYMNLLNRKFDILNKENFIKSFKKRHPGKSNSHYEDVWTRLSKGYDFVLHYYDEKDKMHNHYSIPYIQEQMRKGQINEKTN